MYSRARERAHVFRVFCSSAQARNVGNSARGARQLPKQCHQTVNVIISAADCVVDVPRIVSRPARSTRIWVTDRSMLMVREIEFLKVFWRSLCRIFAKQKYHQLNPQFS